MSSVDYFVGYAIELGSVQYVCAKGFNYLESSIEILSCVIWFTHYFFVFFNSFNASKYHGIIICCWHSNFDLYVFSVVLRSQINWSYIFVQKIHIHTQPLGNSSPARNFCWKFPKRKLRTYKMLMTSTEFLGTHQPIHFILIRII